MKRQHRCILLAFIIWANLKVSFSLPVPEDELDTSTRLLGSSVVTSVSVVTGSGKDEESTFQSRKVQKSGLELPASPAGLLRPDRFQFYTLNKDGEVVTKQMTEKEIQSLIAAGGGHLPPEIHETQMAGEVPTGGMKVADVVQNVQNVLKGELSKPTTVMTSVPTIPGHANDEWSSILPAILAGDMESQSLNIPETEVITEMKNKDPIPEVEVKPAESDLFDVKIQAASVVKPLLEASKLKSNASSVTFTKTPDSTKIPENKPTVTKEKPSVLENHFKKPVVADKGPQDSISSGIHYEPINTYSTSKPSTSSEKLSSKPSKPSSSDSYSKIPIFSSSEKPTVFQIPFKPAESSKPEQGQKPQISVRPDPGNYEEKPLVSVGPDKLNKPSTPSYILLPEKQTQGPLKTTVTKKPTTFATSNKPFHSFRPEYPPISYSEIPMIPVQVITADQILTSTPQYQKDNSPVFQVLNTISADTVTGSNSSKIGIQEESVDEEPSKYPHPVYKPDKIEVQAPEKVTSEQPKTPLPEIIFSETSFFTKLPELVTTSTKTETPDMVSVVSETHSTSIKIPGHPEIPIPTSIADKPITTPKPEMKTTTLMQSSVKEETEVSLDDKPSEGDKHSDRDKPSISSISSASETTVPSTSPADKEATTQKMIESEVTTDLISETTTFDISETSTLNINKESETTTDYTSETSTIPVPEETQFQKIPDITPDGQMISPETSAIEKIIETLHHPTESKFGTSTIIDIGTGATDFGTESEYSTAFTILGEEISTPDYTTFVSSQSTTRTKSETTEGTASSIGSRIRTSTAPTFLNLGNATDGTPKPYEPLPTELADSLSSMISQISETIPSFLPVSQSSLLTEVTLKGGNKYNSTKIDTYQQNTESTRVTQELPNFETTMYKNANVDVSATVRLEDATENLKGMEISSSSKPEMETSTTSTTGMKNESVKDDLVSSGPVNSTSSQTSPSTGLSSTASPSTGLSSTASASIASSSTALPSTSLPSTASPSTASPSTTSPSTTSPSTASPSTTSPSIASSSTDSPSTYSLSTASSSVSSSSTASPSIASSSISSSFTVSPSTAFSSTVSSSTAETTESLKPSPVSVMDQTTKLAESAQDQIPQSDESQKVSSVNITEKPIIRVSVTESGSTNLPQVDDKINGNTESTVIRIQVSDAISMINNLLESAPVQTTTSYVTLNLPGGNIFPNNIGSGLVAGFPSGNETALGPGKPPVLSDPLSYSNTSPSFETSLEPTEGSESKNKNTVNKTKDTEYIIKDNDENTEVNKENVKDTEEKVKNTKDKIKNTEEKIEIKVNSTEEETSTYQNKTKNNNETKIPVDNIKISNILEKESTTEKDLLILTTNVDKIESTTKEVEETQTELISTEIGSSSTEIKNNKADSVPSSSLTEVANNIADSVPSSSLTEVAIEKISSTSETSMNLKNETTPSFEINQTKTSSEDQPTTESLATQKENITMVKNITDIPTLVDTSLATEINETETSASEKLETIITTTLKSNMETAYTTPKSNVVAVVTTPKSKITSPKPTKVISQSINKTRKPETPVVRLDISPETNHSELQHKIQLAELPIIDKVTILNFNAPTEVTTNFSVSDDKLPLDNKKPVNPESNTLKDSEAYKNVTLSNDDKKKKVDIVTDTSFEQTQKNIGTAEGQEVRIRVNNTAVLVSKIPPLISINETKTGGVDKEVEDGSKVPSVSIKEEQVKRTEDKIDQVQPETLKNSSYDSSKEEQKKPDSAVLDQKDKPSVNDTKLIIVNTTQSVDSEKIIEDKIPNEFKPIPKPITKVPSLTQKGNIDQTKENAYNKLGEFGSTSTESNKNKPSVSFQKKNVTSTITKPVSSQKPTKPTSAAKPIVGPSAVKPIAGPSTIKPPTVFSGTKPGSSSMKPSLPSKNRPSSHETISHKPTESTKIKNPDENLNTEEKWALIPQQSISSTTKIPKPTASTINSGTKEVPRPQAQRPQVALDASQSAIGLDGSITNLDPDIISFSNLCNELAFSFWSAANKGLSTSRSLTLSPFGMTSMLAMVFLGARGPTSDEMNDVLKLDDVATFNPHLVFQNITDTVSLSRRQGIANAAFVRELFADKTKVGKLMPFYKEQAQQFYEGFVEEVNFAAISDIVRRRTNLLVRKQTGGRIRDFVRTNTVPLRPPLAALSANVFQTECNTSAASSEGRDGELYFAVSPAVRQRKLIPVPATVWKSGVLAGYEPSLDATAIALGGMEKLVSIIFVVPGQQGHMAPGDNLDNLEVRLARGAQRDGSWTKLLKVLIPRTALELQVPKFSHRSIVNATAALKRMGLAELFSKHADLKGINGVGHDLHLADVLQMNLFSTCGDENISSGRHHVEIYPGPPMRNFRKISDYDESLDALADGDFYPESEEPSSNLSSVEDNSTSEEFTGRSSRQTEISEKPRLKLDRPFLYFVRHNPTGLILHMGRFNPRLLP